MSIVSRIEPGFNKFIGKIHQGEWFERLSKDPAAAAKLVLWSTASKDAINCLWYTYQSATNKKIPKEKRKFVSFLDLFNGVLNVAVPIALGADRIQKGSDWLFDRTYKKLVKFNTKQAAEDLANSAGIPKFLKDVQKEVDKALEAFLSDTKGAKKGLGAIAMLIVSQILCKRVLTPFLSTPAASYTQEFMDKRDAKKHGKTPQEQPPAQTEQSEAAQIPVTGSTSLLDKFKKQ